MKLHRSASVLALAALICAAIIGLILTARAPKPPARGNARLEDLTVDQRPLETAQALAPLASTDEERRYAADAARIADHEVDLAFAAALHAASEEQPAKKDAAMEKRVSSAQARVKQLQAAVKDLAAQAAKAKGQDLAGLQQQQTLAEARLDLAQDELADAQQDMARASGDEYSRIQRAWQQHEQTQHGHNATSAPAAAAGSSLSPGSLIARWTYWSGLGSEAAKIVQARAAVLAKQQVLTGRHNALEKSVADMQDQKQALDQQSSNLSASLEAKPGAARSREPAEAREKLRAQQSQIAAETLMLVHAMSADELSMAAFDRRIQDLQSLAAVYAQWESSAALRARAALHRLIRSVLWILVALLVALVAGRVATRVFEEMHLERKQRATLHGVAQFVIQALAALVILLVLFGSPNHVFTVLGLAGAGLTVALKDFVVAFCGWFVLMGKNGIHVGDWVEINGVRGEVTEIGLLRTQLLETGNWTEAGHPTGRHVAFLNSFAVEGYFFIFSTAGQWMWDEVPVMIPKADDPYPIIREVRRVVEKETEESAREAEQEWRRAAHHSGFRSFPAKPEINMTPSDSGVKLVVRYMTKAAERYEVRSRLSHALVKLFHQGEAPVIGEQGAATGLPSGEPAPASGDRPTVGDGGGKR